MPGKSGRRASRLAWKRGQPFKQLQTPHARTSTGRLPFPPHTYLPTWLNTWTISSPGSAVTGSALRGASKHILHKGFRSEGPRGHRRGQAKHAPQCERA